MKHGFHKTSKQFLATSTVFLLAFSVMTLGTTNVFATDDANNELTSVASDDILNNPIAIQILSNIEKAKARVF